MYMVEISEDKIGGLSENLEKGLRYIGKAMQCIDELSESKEKRGYRSHEEDDEEMSYRGMYRGKGRYDRY